MPKYIEKDKLPQFKYYNFCESKHDYWGDNPEPYAAYHIETPDGSPSAGEMQYIGPTEDLDISLAHKDLNEINKDTYDDDGKRIFKNWADSLKEKQGKQYELLKFLLVTDLSGKAYGFNRGMRVHSASK